MENDTKYGKPDDIHIDRPLPYHSTEWSGALGSESRGGNTHRRDAIGETLDRGMSGDSFSPTSGTDSSIRNRIHSGSKKAHEKLDSLTGKVKPAVRQKLESVRAPVQHKIEELRPVVDARIRATQRTGRDALMRGKSFLRNNPAILPALTTGVGLIAGMMARRALRRRKPLGVVVVEPRHGGSMPA